MTNALPIGFSVQEISGSLATNDRAQNANPALLYVLSLGSDQSRRRVLASLNKIATEFGYPDAASCEWERMRFSDINTLKSRWQKANKAPATINLAVALLRGVAKQAWLANLISDKDYMAITMTKGARGSRLSHGRALNPSESHLVIQSCREEDTRIGKRDAAIFALGLGCGLRRNELGTLRLKDVDRSEHSLRILGKGNKERIVYLNEQCVDAVTKYTEARKSVADPKEKALFISKRGNRITNRRVEQIIDDRLKACGLAGKGISVHKLRHTAATLMYQNGVDVRVLKEVLGHENLNTTQIYTHVVNTQLRDAINSNPVMDIKNDLPEPDLKQNEDKNNK